MKVIVLFLGDLLHCPPAMSLINTLNETGDETVLVCFPDDSAQFRSFLAANESVRFVPVKPNSTGSLLRKAFRYFGCRRQVKGILKRECKENSLLWVLSNGSLKYLGNYVTKMRYVLHLLELTEQLYLIESKHLFPFPKKYYLRAKAVVECEYNRAHITKAWWSLPELPFVLQNKPYNRVPVSKDTPLDFSPEIAKLFETELKDKKIILYQGNASAERPLDPFIDAVSELPEEYVFVAMTNGVVPYRGKCDRFYQIPFVAPPDHLKITARAYIGILSYVPVKNGYSILNALYCAPNKIWEYSQFGVPMLSNDLPALRSHFLEFGDGVALASLDRESVKRAILQIDEKHGEYADNALRFFDTYDFKAEVKRITEHCFRES